MKETNNVQKRPLNVIAFGRQLLRINIANKNVSQIFVDILEKGTVFVINC